MSPVVSVIIPSFNCARYLSDAVESVLSQTFTDLECIIVDDGSTDNTLDITNYLARNDDRVRYFFKENGGVSSARNMGIEQAKGEWIQFLDADDGLHKDKVKFQLSYLTDQRPVDDVVFYSDYEVVWQDKDQNIVRKVTNIVGKLTNKQILERIMKWSFEPDIALHSNSVLFKRSVFKKKMYREDFWAFEDLELFVDLLIRNVSFVYTPIVGMTYRIHESNMTKDRNQILFAYFKYLEAIDRKDSTLLQLCPNMGRLIKEAILEKDKNRMNRILELVKTTQAPLNYNLAKIKINNLVIVKFLFIVRLLIPIRKAMMFFRKAKKIIGRAICSPRPLPKLKK